MLLCYYVIILYTYKNDIRHSKKVCSFFLIGCIGTHTFFVIIAKYINIIYLPILGYLALIIAIGFTYIYIYLTGTRKTGPEIFDDKICRLLSHFFLSV